MPVYEGEVISRETSPEGAGAKPYTGAVIPLPKDAAPKEETFSGALEGKSDPYGAGFISGNLNLGISGLAGLPVDTATNAINLGIAGYGAATGTTPPLIERPFGGSQQISDLMRRGGLVGPSATPQSTMGRYGAAALQQAPSALLGRPTLQQLPRAVSAAMTSGVAGEAASDIAGPEYAGVGSMLRPNTTGGYRELQQPSFGEEATLGRQAENFAKAKSVGLPVPPRAMKPNKPQQSAEDTVNRDLRRPPGTAVSRDTLDQYRSLHAPDYMRVNEVPFPIQANDKFRKAILDMAVEERKLRSEMPNVFQDIGLQNVLSDFTKKDYTPEGAMATVQRLRDQATANLTAPSSTAQSKTLGLYQRKLANVMEDLIGDNLKARGMNDLYNSWTQAREKIAKSFDVQMSLDQNGKFDAKKFAALESDRPITGQLKALAQAVQAFPQAATSPHTDDSLLTRHVNVHTLFSNPEAAAGTQAAKWHDRFTLTRPYQYFRADPASYLTPEQQRMIRALGAAGATQRQQQDIPPPP